MIVSTTLKMILLNENANLVININILIRIGYL